jgi:hypothetical protein
LTLIAKVFGNGDVTVACNESGACILYVGQKQIECIQKIRLECDIEGNIILEVSFPRQSSAAIEANKRAVAQFPWVRVIEI